MIFIGQIYLIASLAFMIIAVIMLFIVGAVKFSREIADIEIGGGKAKDGDVRYHG